MILTLRGWLISVSKPSNFSAWFMLEFFFREQVLGGKRNMKMKWGMRSRDARSWCKKGVGEVDMGIWPAILLFLREVWVFPYWLSGQTPECEVAYFLACGVAYFLACGVAYILACEVAYVLACGVAYNLFLFYFFIFIFN